MSEISSRREFLKAGSTGTLAAVVTGGAAPAGVANEARSRARAEPPPQQNAGHRVADEYDGFSRFRPSRGNDPDGDFYLGKRVPGFRAAADGPAPFIAPDLKKLPWEMKNGAKEFHLVCQQVSREFLPGYWMDVYGFNGSMPGPTIEVNQGDRIRMIVHNELPEETAVHWHGFELPVQMDGADTLTQNLIRPGKSFQYEFDVHEEGTFFYHSHNPMQEAFGMVGWMIVHPRTVWDPPVDRDFGVIFQNFQIRPMQTVSDSWAMDWSWHTINGRSGPYATPLLCKHGERIRVRILDFSPQQHHPIHLHGHTFWVTGHEGARIPKSAWIPRNTELIGVAQAADFEFIANNPGDWMFHCHMTHHMMNHMVRHVGPRMREEATVDSYRKNLEIRPRVQYPPADPKFGVPGYPQRMQGMSMSKPFMETLWSRREVQGMRANAMMSLAGLMTVIRVLPEDLYQRIIETNEDIPKGEVFQEIVRRFGDISHYQPAPPDGMEHMMKED